MNKENVVFTSKKKKKIQLKRENSIENSTEKQVELQQVNGNILKHQDIMACLKINRFNFNYSPDKTSKNLPTEVFSILIYIKTDIDLLYLSISAESLSLNN